MSTRSAVLARRVLRIRVRRSGVAASLCIVASFLGPSAIAQQVVAPRGDRYVIPFDASRGVLSYSDLLEEALEASVGIHVRR